MVKIIEETFDHPEAFWTYEEFKKRIDGAYTLMKEE
jgi:hypothetical protein